MATGRIYIRITYKAEGGRTTLRKLREKQNESSQESTSRNVAVYKLGNFYPMAQYSLRLWQL